MGENTALLDLNGPGKQVDGDLKDLQAAADWSADELASDGREPQHADDAPFHDITEFGALGVFLAIS